MATTEVTSTKHVLVFVLVLFTFCFVMWFSVFPRRDSTNELGPLGSSSSSPASPRSSSYSPSSSSLNLPKEFKDFVQSPRKDQGRKNAEEEQEEKKPNNVVSSSTNPTTANSKGTSSSSSLPLRYETPQILSSSQLASLKKNCNVLDLDKAAVYNSLSQQQQGAATAKTGTIASTPSLGANGFWSFREWCSEISTRLAPNRSIKVSSNENQQQKAKREQDKTEGGDKSDNNAEAENEAEQGEEDKKNRKPFLLKSSQLRSLFQDEVTIFVGDSVVRNHFVLTLARMCNEKNRDKCMKMMPTYEYDIIRSTPSTRGPLGCIPKPSAETSSSSSAASEKERNKAAEKSVAAEDEDLFSAAERAKKQASADTLTDCYLKGKFSFVPAPGLSSSKEPKRTERKKFLKKGIITPLIRAEVDRSIFYYIPVNTPNQIVKFAKWLSLKGRRTAVGNELLKAKTVFVSTGPHLSMRDMNQSILWLKPALEFVQSTLPKDSTILLPETTHLLNAPFWYSGFIDSVMDRWREELVSSSSSSESSNKKQGASGGEKSEGEKSTQEQNKNNEKNEKKKISSGTDDDNDLSFSPLSSSHVPLQIELVPQRFVTVGGYVQIGQKRLMGVIEKDGQEKLRKNQMTCEYYDAQHPALPCQEVLSELMLLAAYTAKAKKSKL